MEDKNEVAEDKQAEKKEQKKEIKKKSKIEIKNEVVIFTLGIPISFNDEKKYEDKETVITFNKSDLKRYNLQCDDLKVYDRCEITFLCPYHKGAFKRKIRGSCKLIL